MNIVNRTIVVFVANFVALVLCVALLSGFHVAYKVIDLVVLVGILTLIYVFVKPLIELVLSPVIVLTLGIASFAVNALVLYVVDIYSQNLTIDNLGTLLLATLIFTGVNTIVLAAVRTGNK